MSGLHIVSVTCPGGDLFPVSRNTRVSRSGKSRVKIICRQESQVQKQVVLTLVLYKICHLIGQCKEIFLSSSSLAYVRNRFGGVDLQKLEEL